MKKISALLLIIPMFFACGENNSKKTTVETPNQKLRREAIEYSVNYAMGKFKTPVKTVLPDGSVRVEENQNAYLIAPSKVYTGLIDYDNIEDAIVSIDFYKDQYIVLSEHLILIGSETGVTLNRSIESDMRIISVKDRIITAEIYTRSRNGPLANCNVCKEVVKYQFRQGELIKTE